MVVYAVLINRRITENNNIKNKIDGLYTSYEKAKARIEELYKKETMESNLLFESYSEALSVIITKKEIVELEIQMMEVQ